MLKRKDNLQLISKPNSHNHEERIYPPRAALVGALSLTALSLGVSTPAHATNFTGYYAVVNWTTSTPVGGSVNTGGAPNSISLTSPDNSSIGGTNFTIAAAGSGTVSFNWSYTTADADPSRDPFCYLLDGVFTRLTDNNGSVSQSGTANFNVTQGQIFSLAAFSFDGLFGASTTTITNFNAPVPEPLTLLGASAAVVFGAAFKRRSGKATEQK